LGSAWVWDPAWLVDLQSATTTVLLERRLCHCEVEPILMGPAIVQVLTAICRLGELQQRSAMMELGYRGLLRVGCRWYALGMLSSEKWTA